MNMIFATILLLNVFSRPEDNISLTIRAGNFKNDLGQAVVHIFRQGDEIPKKPFLKITDAIINGKATFVTNDVPYGEYAAILFHDENSNGILDHRLGFPIENMGFSNEWALSLLSGMPNFSKLSFQFSEQASAYEINLQ